ncbi:hypothetical protein Tco_0383851, partial [Tanacetum coccineum]
MALCTTLQNRVLDLENVGIKRLLDDLRVTAAQ